MCLKNREQTLQKMHRKMHFYFSLNKPDPYFRFLLCNILHFLKEEKTTIQISLFLKKTISFSKEPSVCLKNREQTLRNNASNNAVLINKTDRLLSILVMRHLTFFQKRKDNDSKFPFC